MSAVIIVQEMEHSGHKLQPLHGTYYVWKPYLTVHFLVTVFYTERLCV